MLRRRSGGPEPARPWHDARSHSTVRMASARRPARGCFATDPVFRGASGAQTRISVPGRIQDRCSEQVGSAPRTSRHRVRGSQLTIAPGAARRGLPLRPPSSEEARPRRSPGPGTRRNVWSNPRRSAQYMRQAIDRNHQNAMLDALDAQRTDEADDAEGAAACPSSPAS